MESRRYGIQGTKPVFHEYPDFRKNKLISHLEQNDIKYEHLKDYVAFQAKSARQVTAAYKVVH